jgi:hypothetical protein
VRDRARGEGWLHLALVVLLLAALTLALYAGLDRLAFALRARGGFWGDVWRVAFGPPVAWARVLLILAGAFVALALLLAPIAWAETRAAQRYARREEELRRERPDATVTPYDGPEGEGVAFDGPDGRLLLLRPDRGLGFPREVALPATPASPPEAPSPMGSNGPAADT